MASPYRSITAQSLHYYSRPHSGVPAQAIASAAAWRGDDLRAAGDWRQTFSDAQIAELEAAIAHARGTGKPLQELSAGDFPLPTLQVDIEQWRQQLQHGRGFVLLRGLPVERWGVADTELLFWCLGWHLGLPGAQNRFGELLGHVRDTGADPADPSVREYRTRVNISFHCDAADAVGLLCLRPAKSGGASRIASSVTIFNEILQRAPHLVSRLFRPFAMDAHAEAGLQHFDITPCRYFDGELKTFYHSGYFRSASRYPGVPALDDEERELLDLYDSIANDPAIYLDMELEPGDIQLCSNHTVVHSRTAYEDYAEPHMRRHLLRLWLSFPEPRSLPYRARKLANKAQLVAKLLQSRWQQRQS